MRVASVLLLVLFAVGCRTASCEGGCSCDGLVCACTEAAACTVECLEPECDLTCTGSGGCDFTVSAPASVECTGSGTCNVECLDDCVVSCPGSGRCQVVCAPDADCSISFCPGAVVSCNDTMACGGPCTG